MKNLLLIALVLLAVSGCKKEEVVGPQGPQGKEGNANVESYDFTIYSSSWESYDWGWEAIKEWDKLTEEIINDGGVFVYWAVEDNTFAPLPTTIPAGNGFITILSAFRINEMAISFMPGGGIGANNPGMQKFRAVVIAPKSMALGENHVQKLIEEELSK